jgi:hypothetical protein
MWCERFRKDQPLNLNQQHSFTYTTNIPSNIFKPRSNQPGIPGIIRLITRVTQVPAAVYKGKMIILSITQIQLHVPRLPGSK